MRMTNARVHELDKQLEAAGKVFKVDQDKTYVEGSRAAYYRKYRARKALVARQAEGGVADEN